MIEKTKAVLYCTKGSEYFAKLISSKIGVPLSSILRKVFTNGERYTKLNIEDRLELIGKDAILVCCMTNDDDIMEIYRIGYTLAELGTKSRTFVIPHFAYATMERDVHPGEVVTAKTLAHLLSSIPRGEQSRFMFLDLHTSGLRRYFSGSCMTLELYAEKYLSKCISEHLKYIIQSSQSPQTIHKIISKTVKSPALLVGKDGAREISGLKSDSHSEVPSVTSSLSEEPPIMPDKCSIFEYDEKKLEKYLVFASADLGRPLWVSSFARKFGTDVILLEKRRTFEDTRVLNVIGNCSGRHVMIYDDMIRSGGTLLTAAKTYLENGALSVSAVVSHLAFADESCIKSVCGSPFLKLIIGTNSHPMSQHPKLKEYEAKVRVIDVSQRFADVLLYSQTHDSIS
ncbi:Ribose-phosphate pyrophosphokinase like protein [Aduncisulcus paluster]|uniref:ribose-phosphate diphosphokinase n=1 Tax=Aduncisulcus paluster TaxID=2918883 RepID=A0ABQ5KV88_9EUKA|nr:Ribose-phosphate pyrophosphokinase like protein [Aduncisulcus paluster]